MPVTSVKHTEGFTLIEVLIAMLLLLVGLLGVSQLHFSSFQENRNALYRNQATVMAEDLIDRVRGNPTGLINGRYSGLNFVANSTAPATVVCIGAGGCNPQELATKDVGEWARNFVTASANYTPGIPGAAGTGTIDVADVTGECIGRIKYDVSVSWDQPDNTRGSVDVSACL